MNIPLKRLQQKIKSSPLFSVILTNQSIQFINLITGVITARVLGATGRGEYAVVLLLPQLIAAIGIIGFNWSLAVQAGRRQESRDDLIAMGFYFSVIFGILGVVMGVAIIEHFIPSDKRSLIPLTNFYLLHIPLNYLFLCLLGIAQGEGNFKYYNTVNFSYYILYLLFLIILWFQHYSSVKLFVVANLIAESIVVFYCFAIHFGSIKRGRVRLELVKKTFSIAFPFALTACSFVLAAKIDQVLLVKWMDNNVIGLYVVATSIAMVIAPIGNALGITTFSLSTNIKNIQDIGNIVVRRCKKAFLMYNIIGCMIFFSTFYLITPVFGKDFYDAGAPSRILLFAMIFLFLSKLIDEAMRGQGNPLPGLVSQFVSIISIIVIAYFLVPLYNITGMAIAVLVGNSIKFVLIVNIFCKVNKIAYIEFLKFSRVDFQEIVYAISSVKNMFNIT